MLKINEQLISFKTSPNSWQEAIRLSSQLLLEQGYIDESYIEKMIENVNEFGAYIVIAPQIAMPHSRPEHGVIRGGFAVTIFNREIDICGSKAKAFITLACSHNNHHLKMMQMIALALNTKDKINSFVNAQNKQQIVTIFGGYDE